MEIGKLNRRITVSTYNPSVSDGFGGFIKGSELQYETWCSANPLSMAESLANGLQLGQSSYEFAFRYDSVNPIGQQNKLTYEGREFRIVSVIEVDEYKRVIKVIANERID